MTAAGLRVPGLRTMHDTTNGPFQVRSRYHGSGQDTIALLRRGVGLISRQRPFHRRSSVHLPTRGRGRRPATLVRPLRPGKCSSSIRLTCEVSELCMTSTLVLSTTTLCSLCTLCTSFLLLEDALSEVSCCCCCCCSECQALSSTIFGAGRVVESHSK